ncbi:MAG: flagellar motor protein MotA [Frankiales bacterium]|nr:flagellar motor protein MotA [Frankiales bacterium]
MNNRVFSHRRRTRGVIAAAIAVALVLAACGGGSGTKTGDVVVPGGSGSASAYTGAPPSGDPINVMTIASVNYTGPNYANILTTAKLYESWINAHGGVAHRPLKVTTCDEQGDPNKIAACGRQAVANKSVAVIGSFTFNGASIVPELAASNISWFGICCAASAIELTSPIVQQIGSGGTIAAFAVKAVQDGCKHISLVVLDAGAATQFGITIVKNALKSMNASDRLKSTVLIPLTAQDYSAQVAQATDGTDCIMASIGEANFPPFLSAFASSGGTQRLYGPQGNLDGKVVKPFAEATEGAVIIGAYSDLSLPVWNDYRAAISQYKAPSDQDYNSLGGLGTWAAYVAFQQIVEGMTGPLTAATFLATAQKATVKMNGMSADVDFTKPFTGLGAPFANDYNRTATFDIVHNGKLTPFKDGAFYDMTNAMLGQPLAPADLPPGGQ